MSIVPTSPVLLCDAVDFLLPTTLVNFAGLGSVIFQRKVIPWTNGLRDLRDFGGGQRCLEEQLMLFSSADDPSIKTMVTGVWLSVILVDIHKRWLATTVYLNQLLRSNIFYSRRTSTAWAFQNFHRGQRKSAMRSSWHSPSWSLFLHNQYP